MKNEFFTEISYGELRKIIVDYFKNSEKIELGYASIEYLQDKLSGAGNYQGSKAPYFSMQNDLGYSKFDIPNEDIFEILNLYLSTKGFKLINIEYAESVKIIYGFLNRELDSIIKNTPKR